MNGQVYSGLLIDNQPNWSMLFAQDADQDMDFDEGFEDDDLGQHKPPRRHPFLWIIILLIAVGVVYWTLQPDLSMFLGTDSSEDQTAQPLITSPEPAQNQVLTPAAISVPTPHFGEGQQVLLVPRPGDNTSTAKLKGNASGTKSGPTVNLGEPLTILDGEMVGNVWVYNVRTNSGETGWVLETEIKKKTS